MMWEKKALVNEIEEGLEEVAAEQHVQEVKDGVISAK